MSEQRTFLHHLSSSWATVTLIGQDWEPQPAVPFVSPVLGEGEDGRRVSARIWSALHWGWLGQGSEFQQDSETTASSISPGLSSPHSAAPSLHERGNCEQTVRHCRLYIAGVLQQWNPEQ